MCKMMRVRGLGLLLILLTGLHAGAAEAVADSSGEKMQAIMAKTGITLSGAVEVEAGYGKINYDDPALKTESESDLSLATVELGVDARINPYVLGHVLFLYEEEPDGDIDVDEGYLRLENPDGLPVYAMIGRQYLPFGGFTSHFISDPLTLELGEIRETSVVGGYANDFINVFGGVFNGEVDETDDDNDHINNYVAGFTVTVPAASDFQIILGGSWLSNLADSDTLSGEIVFPGTVADKVGGYAAFASVAFMEKVFFEAEILGAADEFAAGELNFDSGNAYQPKTFNLELAYGVTDGIEIAARYGGSDDCGDLLPESLAGGMVRYSIFDNTTLSGEVLCGKYENDDKLTTVTGQLAVSF